MRNAVSVYAPAAPMHPDTGFPQAPAALPLPRLRVGGPLTAATAPGLRAQLRSYAEQGCTRVVVDLEAVASIDAAGLAALLAGRALLEAQPGGAMLLHLSPALHTTLKRAGALGTFRVWDEPTG
jgi:anti-anti-sigma factor